MIKENMDDTNSGYSRHVGELKAKKIDNLNYEYHAEVKEIHLNTAKMAHGGFLNAMGNAAHRAAVDKRCVTISLEIKFVSAGKLGDNLIAKVKIQKKTRTLVFLTCEIVNSEGVVAVTSGVWKILKA
jgi:acyl-coenzyme A thioesterase PaaI-like protein